MALDRRALLIASLAAAAAGTRVGGAEMEHAPMESIKKMSMPTVAGTIRFDPQARATASDDFGHLVRRMPEGVLLPASDDDIAATIRWAREWGLKIAAQGQRHSVYGRAQVRDGIVIDMRQMRTVHAVEDDRVVVDAGATWSEVLAATLPHELTPPVLTDYLELSVGGTLVVGGVGGSTLRHGVQSDNVIALDVVTGQGHTTTCSPSHNSHLFHATRAGLGQVAVITRATLKLIKAPTSVRQYVLTYLDLRSMLSDQRLLAAENRFDVLQGAIVPTPAGWSFRIDAASYAFDGNLPDDRRLLAGLSDDRSQAKLSTLSYLDYLSRLAALERLLQSNGQWSNPHPWLMTFVGNSQVDEIVGSELKKLRSADLGPFGQIVLSPLRRSAIGGPLLRLPAGDLIFAFNFVRVPASNDSAEAERLVAANRAIYERVRSAGGVLYPVSALPMSGEDWGTHFGPAWSQLDKAKQDFDPARVLTPGYEIF